MDAPILIQGAMEVETDWLRARLEGAEEQTLGGYSFWTGRRGGMTLVISRTGIGELNAACATVLGIEHFHPRAVLNQGIAGAHDENLHIGDIVVGEACVHINGWETPPRGKGEGCAPLSWIPCGKTCPTLPGDSGLAAHLLSRPYEGGRLLGGRLGSGDVFSREYDRIVWLREKWGHLCEDMESVAVYQACRRLKTPCLGVRVISNNELTGEPYTRSVGEELQRFVLSAVEAYGA